MTTSFWVDPSAFERDEIALDAPIVGDNNAFFRREWLPATCVTGSDRHGVEEGNI